MPNNLVFKILRNEELLRLFTRVSIDLMIRRFELVTRGFKLVTRRFELVTREFEIVTRGFELLTHVLPYHIYNVNVNLDLIGKKFNSNKWWNDDKCRCECKRIHVY